jgi:xylulokinase
MAYILVHDVGTTSCKSSIYELTGSLRLRSTGMCEYPLMSGAGGVAEQSEVDWWRGIKSATREALEKIELPGSAIKATAFSAQMQGLVLVDQSGTPVRRPMSYMDNRAHREIEQHLYQGIVKINRWNARKMARWLWITGAAAASVKDPIWKYLWVKGNEPEAFSATSAWLDVKDYLVLKATGRFTMGLDSANATFLFDTRPDKLCWHEGLASSFGIEREHLPEVVAGTDNVGPLTREAAFDLGLTQGIPVFGGGVTLP